MEKLNNFIITVASFCFMSCTAQNDTIVFVNTSEYKKHALNYVKDKYIEGTKVKAAILTKYEKSLLIKNFKEDELKVYSIPIFNIKKGQQVYSEIDNFIELIDFTNNFEKQMIHIYVKDSLVSEHIINSVSQPKENSKHLDDEFDFFTNSILLKKDVPLLICCEGDKYTFDVYAYKEQLEKKYFVFLIEGIDTYFIAKNKSIYALRMVEKNKNIEKNSFKDYLNNLIPEFVEINKFIKSISTVNVHNIRLSNTILRFQKISDQNLQPKTIEFSYPPPLARACLSADRAVSRAK